MNWRIIRLELASNKDFPRGSASRAFLLRLPLAEDGSIDTAGVERDPLSAIVRRFWASEPDQFGRIVHDSEIWLLRLGASKDAATFRLGTETFKLGQPVTIEAPDSSKLSFRVSSISPLGFLVASQP